MNCECICFELVFSLKQPDSAAMFPGRFPNVPDTMWNFGWSPQPMGLQGQFCGGDMMNQQSQAQSQAQTQAQLAALREQNTILNQQLASQAQSHIQHLQQLTPFAINPLHSPIPPPPHRLHSQHLKRQNHLHLWYLHPHKLDPVHPSILKR